MQVLGGSNWILNSVYNYSSLHHVVLQVPPAGAGVRACTMLWRQPCRRHTGSKHQCWRPRLCSAQVNVTIWSVNHWWSIMLISKSVMKFKQWSTMAVYCWIINLNLINAAIFYPLVFVNHLILNSDSNQATVESEPTRIWRVELLCYCVFIVFLYRCSFFCCWEIHSVRIKR